MRNHHLPCANAAIAVVALSLTGCARLAPSPATPASSSHSLIALQPASPYPFSTSTGRSGVEIPAPAALNRSDVDEVALGGVKAIESADTTLDADPNDTVERAAAWLTPGFAEQVRAYPPVAAPGATWNRWTAHRARVLVSTSLVGDDHPPDTATVAYRQIVAVLHPVGRDGWTGADQTVVLFVTVAHVHGQWRIASIQESYGPARRRSGA